MKCCQSVDVSRSMTKKQYGYRPSKSAATQRYSLVTTGFVPLRYHDVDNPRALASLGITISPFDTVGFWSPVWSTCLPSASMKAYMRQKQNDPSNRCYFDITDGKGFHHLHIHESVQCVQRNHCFYALVKAKIFLPLSPIYMGFPLIALSKSPVWSLW